MSAAENPQGASTPSHKNKPRSRQPWWRAYDGLPTCSRWRVVSRRTHRPHAEVVAVVVYLLNEASVAKVRGDIGGFDAETCAAGLDMELVDVEAIVAALEATGWLAGGRVATWDDRQVAEEDSTAAERKAKQRDRERAAKDQGVTACHGAVTADHDRGEERRTEETRVEQTENLKYDSAPNADLQKRIGFFFDNAVWPAYPKGKVFYPPLPARKKFVELVMAGADPDEILAGVERYAASAPDPQYVRSPLKFLEDEDWNDGEALGDREWDANNEGVLWLPVGTEKERIASARTIAEAMGCRFKPDGTVLHVEFDNPGEDSVTSSPRAADAFVLPLPKDFGKPPIGYFLAETA